MFWIISNCYPRHLTFEVFAVEYQLLPYFLLKLYICGTQINGLGIIIWLLGGDSSIEIWHWSTHLLYYSKKKKKTEVLIFLEICPDEIWFNMIFVTGIGCWIVHMPLAVYWDWGHLLSSDSVILYVIQPKQYLNFTIGISCLENF